MVLVSVIIPTWNRGEMLVMAVKSALQQSVNNIDVLVCDDGSTDNSRDLVAALNDSRVRWLEGDHVGYPSIPRNRGIRESRGEWIAFLDSDDVWVETKLEKQLTYAAKLEVDFISSNAIRIDPFKGASGCLLSEIREKLSFKDLIIENKVITSSVIVRRNIIDRVGGFPENHDLRVGEDYALWLRIAYIAPLAVIDEPLVKYNDDPKNSVRKYSPSARLQRIAALKNFLKSQHTNGRLFIALVTVLLELVYIELENLRSALMRKLHKGFGFR